MNEKLPRPMLDALARTAKPKEHPSADVLSAFVERALAENESVSVAEHLAGCSECREVVFLASGATEETVGEQYDDSRVATLRREFHSEVMTEPFVTRSFGAIPTRASEGEAPQIQMQMKPARRWWPRLVWAGSIAAALVVVGGYFVMWERAARPVASVHMAARPAQDDQAASQVAETLPNATAPSTKLEVGASKTIPKVPPKAAPPVVAAAKGAPQASTTSVLNQVAVAPPPPTATGTERKLDLAKTDLEKDQVAIGGATPAAPVAAPRASGFAPSSDEVTRSLTGAGSGQFTGQKAAVNLMQSLHPGWRITSEGHLEHHTSEGWSRVLADQKNSFRVVAIVGNEVWVGGNGGMLFHSVDGGQSWKKVAVQGVEAAAIVSVRFDDTQNGEITTEYGSSYTTRDGGATWAKE